MIDHDLPPEADFPLGGDSVPKPLGFIAFGPECTERGSGLHRPASFRRLMRRSGRIPAEPYPPPRRLQNSRICELNPTTDSFCTYYGSEYINHTVARLLQKLLIEQTKSRPRRSNDNGLVETKNGSVIRKHMGYGHIASAHAETISRFYREHLNPYVNLHRPCAQAEVETDAKGRKKRQYRRYQTPLETLLATPNHEQLLRPGQSAAELRQQAARQSDTEAARQMQTAKQKLFTSFRKSA